MTVNEEQLSKNKQFSSKIFYLRKSFLFQF